MIPRMNRQLARGCHRSAIAHRSPPQYYCRGASLPLVRFQSGTAQEIPTSRAFQIGLAAAALVAGASVGHYAASAKDDAAKILKTTTFDGKHAEYHVRANGQVFDVVVPSQQAHKSTHATLTSEETEALLKANEKSIPVKQRPGNPILRWDYNLVPANPACEDRITIDLLKADELEELVHTTSPFWPKWREFRTRVLSIVPPWKKGLPEVSPGPGQNDLAILSVFDGHQGSATVELLSRVLHPTLARALGTTALHDRDSVSLAEKIKQTYIALDDDIHQASLEVVKTPPHVLDPDTPLLPHPPPSQVIHGSTETVGTTALTAVIDAESDSLHVINVGDCRAVAGWYNPLTGKWRAQVLNREHSPWDPEQAAKLYEKHPGEEGRAIWPKWSHIPKLMGFGDFTHVFGDSHFKRSAADSKLVEETLETRRPGSIDPYLTPPYLDAEPDVLSTALKHDDGEELKFVILGSDGLWARLSPEEGCLLTAAHYSPMRAPDGDRCAKTDLAALIPFDPPQEPRPWPQADLPCTTPENSQGDWLFKDKDNAATHLVRNCLARGDDQLTHLSLSSRGGLTRRMRDDTAAVVIFFK